MTTSCVWLQQEPGDIPAEHHPDRRVGGNDHPGALAHRAGNAVFVARGGRKNRSTRHRDLYTGCGRLVFEGSDGTRTLTSADIKYSVAMNSGTMGDIPEPPVLHGNSW